MTRTEELRTLARDALRRCGVDLPEGGALRARTPITGEDLFAVPESGPDDVAAAIDAAHEAFLTWRAVPAPVRGALVKRFGELLAEHKTALADLVGIEVGKIRSEALGEIQEMIDICDYAVGLSRQLEGRTMPSERPGHRLMETWHPLGVVGVISAFNFPAAVWAWNTALALVCGDTVVWKASELTPLTRTRAARSSTGQRASATHRRTSTCSWSAAPRRPRRCSTAGSSLSSAPPGRSGWVPRSRRGWPPASAG
jgi:aldehyde dehydrogenase (NAD+)